RGGEICALATATAAGRAYRRRLALCDVLGAGRRCVWLSLDRSETLCALPARCLRTWRQLVPHVGWHPACVAVRVAARRRFSRSRARARVAQRLLPDDKSRRPFLHALVWRVLPGHTTARLLQRGSSAGSPVRARRRADAAIGIPQPADRVRAQCQLRWRIRAGTAAEQAVPVQRWRFRDTAALGRHAELRGVSRLRARRRRGP